MNVRVSQPLTERLPVKCRLNKQCVGSKRNTITHLNGQTPTTTVFCSVVVSDAHSSLHLREPYQKRNERASKQTHADTHTHTHRPSGLMWAYVAVTVAVLPVSTQQHSLDRLTAH